MDNWVHFFNFNEFLWQWVYSSERLSSQTFFGKCAAWFISLSNPSKCCNWSVLQNNRLPLVFLHGFSQQNELFEHKAVICMFTEQCARSVWIYHTDQFLRIPAGTWMLQKGQVTATLALKPTHSSSLANSECHLQVLQHWIAS